MATHIQHITHSIGSVILLGDVEEVKETEKKIKPKPPAPKKQTKSKS